MSYKEKHPSQGAHTLPQVSVLHQGLFRGIVSPQCLNVISQIWSLGHQGAPKSYNSICVYFKGFVLVLFWKNRNKIIKLVHIKLFVLFFKYILASLPNCCAFYVEMIK